MPDRAPHEQPIDPGTKGETTMDDNNASTDRIERKVVIDAPRERVWRALANAETFGEWFGATHYGVTPDLITFAKAVTSGYLPLGGVVVGPAVRQRLEDDPSYVLKHGHTYSGHPTACAAGIANLGVLRDEHLLDRVPKIAERLGGGFTSLAADGLLAEARGAGAVWAAGLHEHHDAPTLRNALLERGVIARPIGTSTLAYCPPLVITDEQVDTLVDTLADVLR